MSIEDLTTKFNAEKASWKNDLDAANRKIKELEDEIGSLNDEIG
jgi:predicted  nucleic acid-binding Zn-ribbon protein